MNNADLDASTSRYRFIVRVLLVFIGLILIGVLASCGSTASSPAEQIVGKWNLADGTPDISSEFFKDGTYVGRYALLTPMRRGTYTLINDGRRIRLASPDLSEEFDLTIDSAKMTWKSDNGAIIEWTKET
jgi:hypothetical protein